MCACVHFQSDDCMVYDFIPHTQVCYIPVWMSFTFSCTKLKVQLLHRDDPRALPTTRRRGNISLSWNHRTRRRRRRRRKLETSGKTLRISNLCLNPLSQMDYTWGGAGHINQCWSTDWQTSWRHTGAFEPICHLLFQQDTKQKNSTFSLVWKHVASCVLWISFLTLWKSPDEAGVHKVNNQVKVQVVPWKTTSLPFIHSLHVESLSTCSKIYFKSSTKWFLRVF